MTPQTKWSEEKTEQDSMRVEPPLTRKTLGQKKKFSISVEPKVSLEKTLGKKWVYDELQKS